MKPAFNQSIHEYKLYTKDTIRQVTLFYTTLETGVTLKSECTVGCTVSSQSDTIIQTIQGKNEVIFKFTSEDEKILKNINLLFIVEKLQMDLIN